MDAAISLSKECLSERRRLQSYVGRALTRLRAQAALYGFLAVLTVSFWLLALLFFADRYLSLAKLGINIWIIWGGITALGLPYILWSIFSPQIHERLAAVLADDRLKLQARLCTALTLDLNDAASLPFSEAFYAEALSKLQALEVRRAFPIRLPKASPLLLLPLSICAGIYLFMPYQDRLGLIAAQEQKRKAEAVREKTARKLAGQLEDLKKKTEGPSEEGSPQFKVKQLLQRAAEVAKELKDGQQTPEEALLALGDIKRRIEEQKENLAQGKDFLDRLEKLKAEQLNLEDSALTRQISEALKEGDAGMAARQMRKLAQQIKQDILDNPNKTDEQKKQELENLKRELEKLAGALAEDQALRENLQELSQKVMSAAEFESLQNEIKKLREDQGQGGKKLGDDIERQIEETADELERLEEENDANLSEEEEEEMENLDEAEESVDEAMEGLAGGEEEGKCGGDKAGGQQGGKKAGGNKGSGKKGGKSMKGKVGRRGQNEGGKESGQGKQGGRGQGKDDQQGKPGNGLGGGQGVGHRPYRDGDAEFTAQKVRGQMKSGAISGLSHFRGQGAKGDAPADFIKAMQTAEQENASSLELEHIPTDARDVVKDYFSKVKEDMGNKAVNKGEKEGKEVKEVKDTKDGKGT